MLAVIVEGITTILALCGLGYLLRGLVERARFVRRKRPDAAAFHPRGQYSEIPEGFRS